MHRQHRRKHNQEFVERLKKRNPERAAEIDAKIRARAAALAAPPAPPAPAEEMPEGVLGAIEAPEEAMLAAPDMDMILETIVDEERPVLFLAKDRLNFDDVTIKGFEAERLVNEMKPVDDWLNGIVPLVGRIDVSNFPGEYVGTGWFVEEDIVVTNRHVASLIAQHDGRKFVFRQGVGNRMITASVNTTHEWDDTDFNPARDYKVTDVLYIETRQPHDIAFLKVARRVAGDGPKKIEVARADVGEEQLVCVVGYPARASKKVIPNQQLMEELYLGRYDVKRCAPGYTMATAQGTSRHDCTTLGGNSGSVVLDPKQKKAVGLHFAGLYEETNYAVRASVLTEYIEGKRWNQPVVIETKPAEPPSQSSGVAQSATGGVSADGVVSLTVPLEITIRLGTPGVGGVSATVTQGGAATTGTSTARAEEAVRRFWKARPEGVTGVRVGFLDEGDTIGDVPCISVSAPASQVAAIAASGPQTFEGFSVRYEAAGVVEQMEAMPQLEVSDTIAYDDDARTTDDYSFDVVDEPMDLLLHVGPEYSWDPLQEFLGKAEGHIVSAMYEFHAQSVREELQKRLDDGASLTLVLDNATFHAGTNPDEEIDAEGVFSDWARDYGNRFEHVVAPEGKRGLISDSYHIKVTVRDDDTFWLSSGNWKMKSSQPVITDDDRENSGSVDLKGNREWHVIVRNKTLADRFRAHILQDYKHSRFLLGEERPESAVEDVLVDVPMLEGIELERKPPSALVKPRKIDNKRKKVQPLLTPDREGAVYADAVLELIESARTSLLFQIPYIKTPSRPGEDRGNIDTLLRALVDKLKTLPDARVILSTSGSKYSSPRHVAWYFKSKGVDIDACLRSMDKHHTKGMIVDGRRVLIGSHNWSAQGVSLNRDASLIFHDATVAKYYAEAFEVDWLRANPINPKKFTESVEMVREAVGAAAPPGYERMSLREFLHDD